MNPDNFLNILKGDKDAMRGIGSGKVIDRFVNLVLAYLCLFE